MGVSLFSRNLLNATVFEIFLDDIELEILAVPRWRITHFHQLNIRSTVQNYIVSFSILETDNVTRSSVCFYRPKFYRREQDENKGVNFYLKKS